MPFATMNVLALDTASPEPARRACSRAARLVRGAPARRTGARPKTCCPPCIAAASPRAGIRARRLRAHRRLLRAGLLHGTARGARDRVGPRPRRSGIPVEPVSTLEAMAEAARASARARVVAVPRRRARRGRRASVRPRRPGRARSLAPRDAPDSRASGGGRAAFAALPATGSPSARCSPAHRRCRRRARPRPSRGGRGADAAAIRRHLFAPERRRGETWRFVSRGRRPTGCVAAPGRSTSTKSRGSRRSRSRSRGSGSSSRASSWSRYRYVRGPRPRATAATPRDRRLPLRGLALRGVPHQQDRDRPAPAPPRATAAPLLEDALARARSVGLDGRHARGPRLQRCRRASSTAPTDFAEAYRRRAYYQDGEDAFAMVLAAPAKARHSAECHCKSGTSWPLRTSLLLNVRGR